MKSPQELLAKIEMVRKENPLDLSKSEDLAVGVMNLISAEEHLFYTAEKTGKTQYLDLLNDVRNLRIETYRRLVGSLEGEGWCTGKHLLASSMRLMEVGTKSLKSGDKNEAKFWFDKSFELFGLFWRVGRGNEFVKDNSGVGEERRLRFPDWLKRVLDCCKE